MATGRIPEDTPPPSSDQNNNDKEEGSGDGSQGKILHHRPTSIATGRLMSNLPYMGELTFDSRPRRGRKPKKADICHLISKNYGITFPLTYVNHPNSDLELTPTSNPPIPVGLTKRKSTPTQPRSPTYQSLPLKNFSLDESRLDEPLNLCLRDRNLLTSRDSVLVSSNTPSESNTRIGKSRRKRLKKGNTSESVQVSTPIPPPPPPPPSEVSICKFKFTGGAKPTLQEKKMLSVDAGGNFRFYSDKQPGNRGGKNFGSRGSMRDELPVMVAPVVVPPPEDFTQPSSPESSSSNDSNESRPNETGSKRKRRTRKSLMREKLEKTFKEKGFLIQTQQLESAEGATYCKFRQLRKFTRYLFRSWKDYLPENVKDAGTTQSELPHTHQDSVSSTPLTQNSGNVT